MPVNLLLQKTKTALLDKASVLWVDDWGAFRSFSTFCGIFLPPSGQENV